MSKLCDQVLQCLKQAFPEVKVYTEKSITIGNQLLFIDIWVPQLRLAIEVHGKQHDQFVEHFHGTADNFRNCRRRDRIKEEWVASNGYTLVVLRETELPIATDRLLEKIYEKQSND
jgi:very-short-patch-repair endonuclease